MKPIGCGILILIVAFALLAVDFLGDAGVWREIEPHFQGTCKEVDGVVGAEDIVVHRPTRMVFISSQDRRAAARGETAQGAIYGYDLSTSDSEPVELTADFDGPLHPHGISLWEGDEGIRLFVVNHPAMGEPTGEAEPAGDTVEIFVWEGGELRHLETVRDELLQSLNDVAAVGPRSFYATNDHGNRSPLGRTLEDYLRLARANVVYFDGERTVQVADDITYANGINVSPQGDEVYVAATTGLEIRRYARDPSTGALELEERIEVDSGVDNIDVDRHGNLWVASHPQMLRFLAHASDPAELSPSQVLWLEPRERQGGVNEGGDRFLETYLSDGSDLSGSSVAVAVGARLLIGSVFEEHFLVCERQ